MRFPSRECCFCQHLVLGIGAQDTFLDPYHLQDDQVDLDVSENGITGYAHAACLASSPWSEFWRQRLFQNFTELRSFKKVESMDTLAAFSVRNQEFVVFRSGTVLRFNASIKATSDGYFFDDKEEVTWDLRNYQALARYLASALKRSGSLEVADFLRQFHSEIGSKVYSDVDGLIFPYEDDSQETFASLEEQVFGGVVCSKVRLDDNEAKLIEAVKQYNARSAN